MHNASDRDKIDEKVVLIDMKNKELFLKSDNRVEEHIRRVSIYSPYWVKNKTDLKIAYRQDTITNKDEFNTLRISTPFHASSCILQNFLRIFSYNSFS